MAQWGQGQGYPPQQGQFQPGFGGGIGPQPTGFQGQRPGGFQQPQQTGFPGQMQAGMQPQMTGYPGMQPGLQAQPTGYPGQQQPMMAQQTGFQQQNRPPMPPMPPVPPLPAGISAAPTNSSFLGAQQPNRFLTPSPGPGFGGAGLVPQRTGFGGGGLVPQPTGFVDPRLQMMSSTFMPANPSMPFTSAGTMQFAVTPQQQQGLSLHQSIQQHNQAQRGAATTRLPWALSKAEKKQYDGIFRVWSQGSGFISGTTALEVFGQSGLPKDDLAKIWSLADVDNRGKLDLAEFHIAMSIIYRRLNGNPVPDVLPEELIPASRVDLSQSVDFVANLLENESRSRTGVMDGPISKLPARSFNDSSPAGAGGRKDATVYRHDDNELEGVYQSGRRRINRDDVRTGNEDAMSDLEDMKRKLQNAAHGLDKAAESAASRTREDEELDRELEDLKYRVRRVQDDLEYVSRGPRSTTKDDERRRLDRELMGLLHDKIPAVERKMKDREARKEAERRDWARERDRRNERTGRYDGRDDSRERGYDRDRERDRYDSRRHDDDRERDRGFNRGTFDRDDRDRDGYRRDDRRGDDRDRDYRRDRDYDRDRPRSPPNARTPPPPPPAAPAREESRPAPPAPSGTPSNFKKLTSEERAAEARRKIEERMRALGVPSASPSPSIDTSTEERLAAEKREAEEKAKLAEQAEEERQRVRQERLIQEKALKEGASVPTSPAIPAAPAPAAPASPAVVPRAKAAAPPPPKPRTAPAPPPARKPSVPTPAPAPRQAPPPVVPRAPPPVIRQQPAAPVVPEVDPEEEAMRQREETLRKRREEREARMKQLEEEEEAARLAEVAYQKRREELSARSTTPQPTPPVPPPVRQATAPPPPPPSQTSPAPPPPPQPPMVAPSVATPSGDKSTNPFSRMMGSGGTAANSPATPPTGAAGTNPFSRLQQGTTATSAPIPPPESRSSPAPPAVKTPYNVAPTDDEEWDVVEERDQAESSDDDDEYNNSRQRRKNLAEHLFKDILPRPQSAAGSQPSQPATPAPPAPAPPAVAPASDDFPPAPPPPPPAVSGAPPPPPAPMAPPAPAPAAAAGSGDGGNGRGALFNAISGGGFKLRKAVTNDRSIAPGAGAVIGGDTAPPEHISAAPRAPSPEPPSAPPAPVAAVPGGLPTMENAYDYDGESYGSGADMGNGNAKPMPTTLEEPEEEVPPSAPSSVPAIQVEESTSDQGDLLEDVDKSIQYRVRSLYAYEGQRAEDLSFGENLILTAHPSKSGGDWWYGTLVKEGKSGFFPNTYVQELEHVVAKAAYSYESTNADEWSFNEGDTLTIVDRSESDWWKVEQNGIIFIVPAAYLEIVEGRAAEPEQVLQSEDSAPDGLGLRPPVVEIEHSDEEEEESSDDWMSFSDSDDESDSEEEELSEEARQREHENRERERQRVLEAAGLIVKQDSKAPPPPRPRRAKSTRRPAPLAPIRTQARPRPPKAERGLPPLPSPSEDPSERVQDAYDRYEAFQRSSTNNRLSIISTETTTPTTSSTLSYPIDRVSSRDASSLTPKDADGKYLHNILGFLGRKTPGNEEEKKTRLVISAPILNTTSSHGSSFNNIPSRENSPAFGFSWSSLVEKSALDKIPSKERRRQEAIFELINTEAAYVRDLQLIVEVFYSSMMPMLDTKAITVVFANIEDILLTNTAFLSELEERQKACRLYIDFIGDLLRKHMGGMNIYMQYCVNEGTAIKVLQSLRKSKPELDAHLQHLREDPNIRNLDLSSYLLAPMQRITRYPLLIKQVLQYTETPEERKDVERSLRIAEKILDEINESIRKEEGDQRLKVLSQHLWIGQGRLDLTAPTRYLGPRRLLKEGPLTKAKSGRKLRGFLCNDILVLTDHSAQTLYRMPVPLSQLKVKELGGRRDDLAFQLELPYPRGGEAIGLRATSAHDCHTWMKAISNAVESCDSTEQRLRGQ